jgi:hypothetical protein
VAVEHLEGFLAVGQPVVQYLLQVEFDSGHLVEGVGSFLGSHEHRQDVFGHGGGGLQEESLEEGAFVLGLSLTEEVNQTLVVVVLNPYNAIDDADKC